MIRVNNLYANSAEIILIRPVAVVRPFSVTGQDEGWTSEPSRGSITDGGLAAKSDLII